MSTTLTLEDLVAEEAPRQKLAQYLDMLQKWNKIYNLTAITDRQEMLSKHIADSLAAGEWLHGDRIIDVGTGAGLPGIPLAIMHPDKTFCLLDSNGKKVRFLKQAIQQLGLLNVTAAHSRVEDFETEQGFSSVISRAFASIYDMLRGCSHLLCSDGRFLAMKGMQPSEELQQLPAGFLLNAIHALRVPGLNASRCIVEITKELNQ